MRPKASTRRWWRSATAATNSSIARSIRRSSSISQSDPLERTNLAADPAHAALVAGFMDKVRARWDMAAFDAAVRESQARRWVVYPALRNGAYYPWDFQPLQKASERYMRNHMDLNMLEESQAFSARRMMTDDTVSRPLELDHLRRAYAVTSKATQVTPLLESAALAKETGAARVFVKPESLQWAGSFKVRGAYWRLKQLTPAEAKQGVVAYSSGNFAQGLAAAGEALGIPSPSSCRSTRRPPSATRPPAMARASSLTDHGERAREEVAAERRAQIAEDEGLALLHPFDDPEIVAGQAGAGLEALEQLDGQGRQRRPAVLLGRRRRADRRRCTRLPLSVAGDRDHRRRACRLQRHGQLAGAWRDRDHAAGAEARSATG